ncbi:MAG: 6,7-dimethyl-8-ribityllumazine synthase [Bacteroidia bacterium]|nr:6,7-dimethyl-8-ribityllumazine synthase [Bacteroidia bacterium]MDW8014810.1 6,7-dimethyl-8-ribityllumazine synthase [Bacteroidia bacterium]
MKTEEWSYTPPESVLRRARVFVLRTAWHDDLMEAMEREVRLQLGLFRFPEERLHFFLVAGSFELIHVAAALARQYAWKHGFAQVVSVKGPTHIQSNLRFPPFFQGNFDSQLRSEFLLESPGPIGYLQPYLPTPTDELPIIIALGCILKGETEHHRYLAHTVMGQLAYLNAHTGVPIVAGVLTPDSPEQAWARVSYVRTWVKAGFLLWETRLKLQAFFEALSHPTPSNSSAGT